MARQTYITSPIGYMQDLDVKITSTIVETFGMNKATIQTTITPRFITILQQAIQGDLHIESLPTDQVSKLSIANLSAINKLALGAKSDRVQILCGKMNAIKLDTRMEKVDKDEAATYSSTTIDTIATMSQITAYLVEHVPQYLSQSYFTIFQNEIAGLDNLNTQHRSCLNFAILHQLTIPKSSMSLIDLIACTCANFDVPSLQMIKMLGCAAMVRTIKLAMDTVFAETDDFHFGRSLRVDGNSLTAFIRTPPPKVVFTQYIRSQGASQSVRFDDDGQIITSAPVVSAPKVNPIQPIVTKPVDNVPFVDAKDGLSYVYLEGIKTKLE